MGELDLAAKKYREGTVNMINEIASFFSDEKKTQLRDFIFSYNQSKIGFINFCLWKNDKGQNIDANSEFRDEVALYIVSNYCSKVPSELLRDIYIESAKCSEKLNGSPEYIPFIIEFLIRETGAMYIKDFCLYFSSSFDFYGACISIDLYDYNVSQLINVIENLMRECTNEDEYKAFGNGKEFLERYI